MAKYTLSRLSDAVPSFFRSRTASWVAIIFFAVLVTLITTFTLQRIPTSLEVGKIATRDIKAERDYEIVDEEATAGFQEAARAAVLPLYAFDDGLVLSIVERVHQAFAEVRQRGRDMAGGKPFGAMLELLQGTPDESTFREAFVQKLGLTVTDAQWKMLIAERMSSRVEKSLVDILEGTMKVPLVTDRRMIDAEKDRGILVRSQHLEEGKRVFGEEVKIDDVAAIASIDDIRNHVAQMAMAAEGFMSAKSLPFVLELGGQLVAPNCTFDRQATEERQAQAVANVKSVFIKVNAGEMIIRNGSRFEPWHLKVLNAIQKETGRGTYPYQFAGTFFIICLFFVIPFYLGERFIRLFHPSRVDYLLMAAVAFVSFLVMRISLGIIPAIQDVLFFSLPDRALNYALPIAGGVMLIRMLISAESALLFAIPMSIGAGLFPETGMRFTVFALVSCMAAIVASAKIDRRTTIMRVGLAVGAVNALAILGMTLINLPSITEVQTAGGIAWFMTCALLGGVTSAVWLMIVLPMIESLSGYVTDIKLLELANLNHPLLRELIVRAPGTYHHSHLVGILAEAAAEAIGANALLVRVGAYYHDIGKMKKPTYFIENAKGAENRHDKLTPHMSAMIVSAHVKEGVDMAEKAGIPKAIIDMIPQHHGTRMIGYFYEKAKALEDPQIQRIDPKDYAYPGPKPQTREAAIMMLADVTEASVRALKEKTSIRIEQMVRRVINDVFAESQLDECELTLKDLNEIARAFVRILLGIYHQRIEYPKEGSISSLRTGSSVVQESSQREVYHLESLSTETPPGPSSSASPPTASPAKHLRKT